jgi:hypothetical protein
MSREIEEREIDAAYARGFEDGLAEAVRRINDGAASGYAKPISPVLAPYIWGWNITK